MKVRVAGAAFLVLSTMADARAVTQAGGIVDLFQPSARDEAMATSYALTAPGPFALSGNPAMMVGITGLSAGYSHSQLVPDLADDVFVDHWSFGYSTGRWALGAMRSILDQGTQTLTDEGGNYVGAFDSEQVSLQIGAAFDVLARRDLPPDEQQIGLRVGANFKHITDRLAPSGVIGLGDGEATARTLDAGLELSVRVLDATPGGIPRASMRFAAAFDDILRSNLEFEDAAQSDPLQRYDHYGAALTLEFLETASFGPAVGLVVQYEEAHSRLSGLDQRIKKTGFELNFAQLASIRIGYHDDEDSSIQAPTVGFGLGLGWTGLPATFRIDYASRPQATDLRRVEILSVQGSWDFGR